MTTKPTIVVSSPPFKKEDQLITELDDLVQGNTSIPLPSQPHISLASSTILTDFLVRDVCPTKLNKMAPYLWVCSTPSHTNIPPLHNHAVHGRTIIPTEDPALHLAWATGRIFMKPLPPYLLSHAFWTHYLLCNADTGSEEKAMVEAALGLLHLYYYSIRHESDFRIAQQSHLNLVPPSVTWRQWCHFSISFGAIENSEVAPRYHYGKLQLSRLHWLVRIYLRELNYYYIDGGYGESFTRYYGPLLFVFAVLSVLLSAMQVGMAVEQLQTRNWTAFWSVCRWFSALSLIILAVVSLFLLIIFVVKSVDELMWAAKAQYRARPRSRIDMT